MLMNLKIWKKIKKRHWSYDTILIYKFNLFNNYFRFKYIFLFKAYIHYNDGDAIQGIIIKKTSDVKLHRFIPNNIKECPFVALVCVGKHNHPPPPPERAPDNIKDNLQAMIKEAIEKDDVVISGSIIQGIIS